MHEIYEINANSCKNARFSIENLTIFIMYFAAFTVMMKPSFSIITGPILFCAMMLLFNKGKYYCVIPLVLIANDSLGTVLLGFGSFYWIIIGFVIFKMIINKRLRTIKVKYIFHFIIILILTMGLYVSTILNIRAVLLIMALSISTLTLFNDIRDDKYKVSQFFFHMAISIFLISANAVVFGGVVFNEESTRLGILGAGIGDPNLSSLIINMGIAILLTQSYRNWILRISMILTMIFAMLQTASITGLLVLLIIVTLYILVGFKMGKVVRNVLICLLISGVALQIYTSVPLIQKNENIQIYVLRVEDKLTALKNKDYDTVTTERSKISEENLKYFSQQSTLNQLTGSKFNPNTGHRLTLTHNTYVDMLIRFGSIGAVIFAFFLFKHLVKAFMLYYIEKKDGEIFLLKVVLIFFSGALSIYSGNVFVLWYFILFIL